jgi:acetyl-CoA carboxylase biotin carboxylase subunit
VTLNSVFIANRGEIAVRIIRACRALGIKTVQAYSAADADSLAVRLADAAVLIGPPPAAKSYLDITALVNAALSAGVDAVHPGYGFLAENADFADAVSAAGLIFVGPDGDAIRLLGDKVAARGVAASAGIPTVPGSDGRVSDVAKAGAVAAKIGFPVMIKAAAGGGGRGIHIATNASEFEDLFLQSSAQAKSAFGDGGLYVEKLIESARHIEVQFIGDGSNFVHCYERECSLQRRRQKIWEEAPAFDLPSSVRDAMCASAVDLARHVGYCGVGTVEFLYDAQTAAYHFIEVNTRIQVEHPVTEMVTGIDLVQTMLRIAGGEALGLSQEEIGVSGHAIECHINAEDPRKKFMPRPGNIDALSVPEGPNVRFDTLLYAGYTVPPFYDSLLGKLIVHGAERASSLKNLQAALEQLEIGGIPTTLELHRLLARDADVAAGRFDTRFLEAWIERNFS